MEQNEYTEFFNDFLVESTELLQDYEHNLLEIEDIYSSSDFSFDRIKPNVQSIFRSIHTIKGLSGMMDFTDIKEYTHEAEEVLDYVRNNKIEVDQPLIDLMFEILDTTKDLIENMIAPGKNVIDVQKETEKFKKIIESAEQHTDQKVEISETDIMESEPEQEVQPEEPIEQEQLVEQEEISEEEIIPEHEEVLPEESIEEPEEEPSVIESKTERPSDLVSNTIRVDTDRLDVLLDTVGEIVIGKNRLIDVTKSFVEFEEFRKNGDKDEMLRKLVTDLSEASDNIKRLIVNLQEKSMKLRMVPIGYTFKKFRRLVRDLSKAKGKDVQLIIEGEATEVDRAIIESMEDPLLHIIRNSIDHGIERPSKRIEKGKDSQGRLKLSAFQESNSIVIEISDDGRGIDPEVVYNKALQEDLIDPNLKLSRKEILNLIFLPGFSTSTEVTDVSGRGVGMDVVKKNILKINGMIDINSEIDKGTKVTMKLPLIRAIIRVLLVNLGEDCYSIPINNVIETLSVSLSDIQYVNGQETVQIYDMVLPIVRLNEVLGIETDGRKEKIFIIVVGIGEKRVGFTVDKLIGQQDIVIKPLGEYLEDIVGISGATILGNGTISLVLDLGSLWERAIKAI